MWYQGISVELLWGSFQQYQWWCLCQYVLLYVLFTRHADIVYQWNGTMMVLPSSSSQEVKSPVTSMLKLLSLASGVSPWLIGPLRLAAPTNSSMITIPSSIPPYGTSSYFQSFQRMISTWLYSGDWAGAVWTGTGIPGQEQSCAQRTGVATCEEFVRNNGGSLNEACRFSSFVTLMGFLLSVRRLGGQERKDISDIMKLSTTYGKRTCWR